MPRRATWTASVRRPSGATGWSYVKQHKRMAVVCEALESFKAMTCHCQTHTILMLITGHGFYVAFRGDGLGLMCAMSKQHLNFASPCTQSAMAQASSVAFQDDSHYSNTLCKVCQQVWHSFPCVTIVSRCSHSSSALAWQWHVPPRAFNASGLWRWRPRKMQLDLFVRVKIVIKGADPLPNRRQEHHRTIFVSTSWWSFRKGTCFYLSDSTDHNTCLHHRYW